VSDVLGKVLQEEERVQYALVFGSRARGTGGQPTSDLDIAVGLSAPLTALELGGLVSRLESESGHDVDLVVLDEAPPALANRVFRDGVTVFVRDARALANRKASAILEYLDFKPIEDLCTRGVLAGGSCAARTGSRRGASPRHRVVMGAIVSGCGHREGGGRVARARAGNDEAVCTAATPGRRSRTSSRSGRRS
jgi:predicted nucleotidyltransferase